MPDANIKAVITAEDRASATLNKIKGEVQGLGNSASEFVGSAFKEATATAVIGLTALTAAGVLSVKAFNESQQAIFQTNAVLASTKGIAGVTAVEVTNLATSLQKVTKFSDEDVRSVENLLLTFTAIGKDIFPEATKTVLDMATALGEDTKSASIQLGKALQDPVLGITALRRVGVNFSDAQKDVIKNLVETGQKAQAQQLILKELHTEFGDSAEAAGKTFAGSLAILNNSLNDVEEGIGYMISQALIPLVGWFAKLVGSVDWEKTMGMIGDKVIELTAKFKKLIEPIKELVEKHKKQLIDFFERFGKTAIVLIPIMAALAVSFAIITSPLFLIITALTLLEPWLIRHKKEFEAIAVQIMNFLKPAFDFLVFIIKTTLIPIWTEHHKAIGQVAQVLGGALVVAIAGAIVGIALLIAAFAGVVQFIAAVGREIINFGKIIVNAISLSIQVIGSLAGALVAPYKSAFNTIASLWNNTVGKLHVKLPSQLGGASIDMPQLPLARAMGGPVSGNTPYIVGEQGPELFVPSSSGSIVPNNRMGGGINITIQAGAFMGSQIEARKFAEQIVGHINDVAGKKNMTGAQLLGSS